MLEFETRYLIVKCMFFTGQQLLHVFFVKLGRSFVLAALLFYFGFFAECAAGICATFDHNNIACAICIVCRSLSGALLSSSKLPISPGIASRLPALGSLSRGRRVVELLLGPVGAAVLLPHHLSFYLLFVGLNGLLPAISALPFSFRLLLGDDILVAGLSFRRHGPLRLSRGAPLLVKVEISSALLSPGGNFRRLGIGFHLRLVLFWSHFLVKAFAL